ncbi:MAG: hypothetical protein GY715_08995 [Planctomycetes bacterium]|nr:hypothetical protein [Planctomycetota bacterium]
MPIIWEVNEDEVLPEIKEDIDLRIRNQFNLLAPNEKNFTAYVNKNSVAGRVKIRILKDGQQVSEGSITILPGGTVRELWSEGFEV